MCFSYESYQPYRIVWVLYVVKYKIFGFPVPIQCFCLLNWLCSDTLLISRNDVLNSYYFLIRLWLSLNLKVIVLTTIYWLGAWAATNELWIALLWRQWSRWNKMSSVEAQLGCAQRCASTVRNLLLGWPISLSLHFWLLELRLKWYEAMFPEVFRALQFLSKCLFRELKKEEWHSIIETGKSCLLSYGWWFSVC